MSSLFQGLADSTGKISVTTDTGSATVPYRGMYVTPDGAVLVATDTGQARTFHSGRAFDQVTGALLVNPSAFTPVNGMGGMVVDVNGGVNTKDQPADVIHQGTGLTTEGYLSATGTGTGPSVPTGASFYAPLSTNLTELVADYQPTFTRSSDGWYWDGSAYQVAGNNVARFEAAGLLMEPAITNTVRIYNANPDAALTNYGRSNGSLERASEPAILAAAGLANICSDGNVVNWLPAQTSGTMYVLNTPFVQDTIYAVSMWINTYGVDCAFSIGGTTNFNQTINTSSLQYISFAGLYESAPADRNINFTFSAGLTPSQPAITLSLFQVEALPVATSPIVTQGATASRAIDALNYANADSYIPISPLDTTILLNWKPKYSHEDPNIKGFNQGDSQIIALDDINITTPVLRYRGGGAGGAELSSWTVSNQNSTINVTNSRQVDYKIALRNGEGASQFQARLWAETVLDGTIKTGEAYKRDNTTMRVLRALPLPMHITDIIIYPVRQDDVWLDANWLCDGCFPP